MCRCDTERGTQRWMKIQFINFFVVVVVVFMENYKFVYRGNFFCNHHKNFAQYIDSDRRKSSSQKKIIAK
jgi:hypothetical protein